jgi:hypothetical protein
MLKLQTNLNLHLNIQQQLECCDPAQPNVNGLHLRTKWTLSFACLRNFLDIRISPLNQYFLGVSLSLVAKSMNLHNFMTEKIIHKRTSLQSLDCDAIAPCTFTRDRPGLGR